MKLFKNNTLEFSLHFLTWMILLFLPAAFMFGSGRSWEEIFNRFWLQLLFMGIIFYLNYFIFVKWLYGDRKVLFIAVNVVLLLLLVFVKNRFLEFVTEPPKPIQMPNASEMRNLPRMPMPGRKGPPEGFRYYMDFLIYLIPVAFAVAIATGKRMQQAKELKREADTIKLQSELQHLKFQLQPHFFFNALNNIYSLIDFAPETAKKSIHSLSKLMRHLLQKSEMESISLQEEIDFLNKYIDLMSLRLTDKTKVFVDFPKHIPNIRIAPLLFVSIVENAFKHGVSATQESDIQFKMEVEENEVYFMASNSFFPKNEKDKSGSGIGIDNLRKRLDLLYPDKYEYNIHRNNNMYIAEMRLKIS